MSYGQSGANMGGSGANIGGSGENAKSGHDPLVPGNHGPAGPHPKIS